jgi:hypothetical protein
MKRHLDADVIDLILQHEADDDASLRKAIAARVAALVASKGRGDRRQVKMAERVVQGNPTEAFAMDSSGSATLTAGDITWHAGRFEVVSLSELRARAFRDQRPRTDPRLRLYIFDGACPATDVGALQATCGQNTLFQVASQFNCLESPGAFVTSVADYFSDSTQGPRASISAFPATLLRHYMAPGNDGTRFVQRTDGPQIDLLRAACGRGVSRNGYFTGQGVDDVHSVLAALEERFEAICVGVHDGVDVVLGHDWDGEVPTSAPRIGQVLTSTAAGGSYGAARHLGREGFDAACRQLLRASYLGTLLAAATLGKQRVVLTLIGGGAFGNSIDAIWNAIQWSLEEVKPLLSRDLDVIVNGRGLSGRMQSEGKDPSSMLLPTVRRFGGALVTFKGAGLDQFRST